MAEGAVKFAELKIRKHMIQATRYEPAQEIIAYSVRIPELAALSNGWVDCGSVADAAGFAARYGYTLEGDAGQMKLETNNG
jgi:hypothetical protein